LKYLKDLRPQTKVVLMTAYDLKKERASLTKPFTLDELIKAVEKAAESDFWISLGRKKI
jgi:CheY-like chemotaxis protein